LHSFALPKCVPLLLLLLLLLSTLATLQLDAQQTYKQALAFWATGNVTYAENALRITHAWASNNQVRWCRRCSDHCFTGYAALQNPCMHNHLPDIPTARSWAISA
jgi:hypothetical protein